MEMEQVCNLSMMHCTTNVIVKAAGSPWSIAQQEGSSLLQSCALEQVKLKLLCATYAYVMRGRFVCLPSPKKTLHAALVSLFQVRSF